MTSDTGAPDWLREQLTSIYGPEVMRADATLPPGLIVLESDDERVAQWCSFPGGLATEALWEDLRSYRESFPYAIRLSGRGEPIRCEMCGTLVALMPESAHDKSILGARIQWKPGIWEHETLRRHTMRRCEWKRSKPVTTREPDFIVLRAYPGAPPGWMPRGLEGRWLDRGEIAATSEASTAGWPAKAVPSGRFEVRADDGAVAEVWEVWPEAMRAAGRRGAAPR